MLGWTIIDTGRKTHESGEFPQVPVSGDWTALLRACVSIDRYETGSRNTSKLFPFRSTVGSRLKGGRAQVTSSSNPPSPLYPLPTPQPSQREINIRPAWSALLVCRPLQTGKKISCSGGGRLSYT